MGKPIIKTKEQIEEENNAPKSKTDKERIEQLENENLDLWDLILFGSDE